VLRRTTMATGNGGQTVRLPAVVTLERDDFGEVYVARCLAVEVASHGDTHEQALANLREALELYFEDSPVPEVDVNPELATVDVRIPA
jgi:predicted RNase H-like HicB family nuclease